MRMGYLGGGVLFAVNVLMVVKPQLFGLPDAAAAVRWSFVTVAVWWLLFTVPLLRHVREQPARAGFTGSALLAGWRELMPDGAAVAREPAVLWFLIAYWLYIDGVNTIIKMAVDYGMSLGLASNDLLGALLLTQFVGFPAALVFGRIGNRLGARVGVLLGLAVYVGTHGVGLLPRFDAGVLPDGGHPGPGAGRRAEPVAFDVRAAGAGGQVGRVLRLLQHGGQVRHRAGAGADGRRGAGHRQCARSILALLLLFVGGGVLLWRVRLR